uniref:Tetraspanin n=1 Tax=Malurus cyaneus samueli TaxID=2593467 RepID=A0A8C5THR5_9PASS
RTAPSKRGRGHEGIMTLLKLSLMAFSFIFWAAGLTMLIIGLWAKVSLGGYLALSAGGYPSAPAILLATGLAVIIWGFLGCFGAATEHRGLLRAYSAFLGAVLAAGLAAGLSALLYRRTLAQGFQEGLHQALLAYGEDDGVADSLDALQRALSCCGVESYRDWLASPWGLEQNGSVPPACWPPASPLTCWASPPLAEIPPLLSLIPSTTTGAFPVWCFQCRFPSKGGAAALLLPPSGNACPLS